MTNGKLSLTNQVSETFIAHSHSEVSSLQAGSSVENGARSTYKGLVTSQERKRLFLSLARPNPTCMVAHQRHRKKCFRMVKFFKVRVFIFISFQNITCYFEFFYEKIYKIRNT